jgi:hypothetical protein
MKRHGKAPRDPMEPGQVKELCVLSAQAMPGSLSPEEAKLLLGERRGLAVKAIQAAVYRVLGNQNPFQYAIPLNCLEDVAGWQNFYRDLFGAETDFIFRIPRKREGAARLIVRYPGITPSEIWEKACETFPCALGQGMKKDDKSPLEDLESIRNAEEGAYGVWLINEGLTHAGFEAFTQSFSTVADDRNSEESLLGSLTLEDGLLHMIKYYMENGHHYPIKKDSALYCMGSRFFGGSMPVLYLPDDGKLTLGCLCGYTYGGGRQVIY